MKKTSTSTDLNQSAMTDFIKEKYEPFLRGFYIDEVTIDGQAFVFSRAKFIDRYQFKIIDNDFYLLNLINKEYELLETKAVPCTIEEEGFYTAVGIPVIRTLVEYTMISPLYPEETCLEVPSEYRDFIAYRNQGFAPAVYARYGANNYKYFRREHKQTGRWLAWG